MTRPVLALVVLLLAGLAGCSAPSSGRASACPEHPAFGTMQNPSIWPHTYNDGQASDFLYLGNSTDVGPTNLTVRVTDGSQESRGYGEGLDLAVEDHRFTPSLGTTHFGAFRLQSKEVASGGVASLFLHDASRRAGCDDRAGGLISNWAASAVHGRKAEPGKGAHVWYAGFWENGTLFDTNLEELDLGAGAHWPRAAWTQKEPHQPIPVYVYDKDRSEEAPQWKDPFSGTPGSGSVLDDEAGAGYFTTIKGFNDALKGLPAGSRIVTHIAPPDAYTQPGRESHPLYGAALVFLIEIEDVVDAPCPGPAVEPRSYCPGLIQVVPTS